MLVRRPDATNRRAGIYDYLPTVSKESRIPGPTLATRAGKADSFAIRGSDVSNEPLIPYVVYQFRATMSLVMSALFVHAEMQWKSSSVWVLSTVKFCNEGDGAILLSGDPETSLGIYISPFMLYLIPFRRSSSDHRRTTSPLVISDPEGCSSL